MQERDYLMRLFTLLTDALNRIINSLDNGDTELAKVQINEAYELLGEDSEYFTSNSLEDIIIFFKNKEGDYLNRIEILTQIMYYESLIETNDSLKKKILEKAVLLLEFQQGHTDVYSSELIGKLTQMKNTLSGL